MRRLPGEVTRRDTLALGTGAATMLVLRPALGQSEAQAGVESHGMSGFGDLKYPADFKHFTYANPNAPKGGQFSQLGSVRYYNQNFNTFNSLNGFIFKGDAALGIELTFATLMVRAFDEPDALYGLAARAVVISPDELTYRFLLRPEAKFHDGTRLDAHDAAFSLNLLKTKGHPIISQQMRDVTAVAKKELASNPIVRLAGALADAVFIDRENREGAIDAMRPLVEEALLRGKSLAVAPEGLQVSR